MVNVKRNIDDVKGDELIMDDSPELGKYDRMVRDTESRIDKHISSFKDLKQKSSNSWKNGFMFGYGMCLVSVGVGVVAIKILDNRESGE